MNRNFLIRLTITTLAVVAPLLVAGSAAAHVVVKPAEVVSAGFTTFTISVPNEKDMPTTNIKLVMPEGLQYVTATQKPGWQIDVTKHGSGEDAHVEAITWSGNAVAVGFRDDFSFSAKVPTKPGQLHWKAYQTYEDGSVVSWDQAATTGDAAKKSETSGPFSVTTVAAQTTEAAAIEKHEKVAAAATNTARRSQTTAAVALVVAIVAIAFATRKNVTDKRP